jgi:hypothetical protein
MVPQRNFPRPPVDGGVGVGIVRLVDNPDTSHDMFPSAKRQSDSRQEPDRPRAFTISPNPVAEFCQLRKAVKEALQRLAQSK